jgi:hypothetical protein
VRAEPPELAPGETTALDVLAVEPIIPQLDGGAPRPLSAVWLACPLPAGTLTVEPCLSGSGVSVIGTQLTASYTPAADVLGGAASTEILLTVAVADTAAGAADCLAQITNNENRPTEPDHCVVSLKRLTISDPAKRTAPANCNPTLADFYATSPSNFTEALDDDKGVWVAAPGADQAPWDIIAERTATVPPDDDGDPVESCHGAQKKSDGTYEALTVSWFTTAGHLDGGRSLYLPPGCTTPSACADQRPETGADTTWYAPTAGEAAPYVDADGLVRFWAVIRDDRGGVGWRTGSLALKR